MANTIELMHPSAHWSPQPKRQIDRLSRSYTAHGRKSPYPPELPLPMGRSGPPSNAWCLGPMRAHNPNDTWIGSTVFAQMTADCPYTLTWFARIPFKIRGAYC